MIGSANAIGDNTSVGERPQRPSGGSGCCRACRMRRKRIRLPGPSQASQSTTVSSTAAAPEVLTEEVTQHYFDALDRLGAILDQDLQVADLRDQVGEFKDEYIDVLVPCGYRREGMPDAERETFDSAMNRAILLSTPPALSKPSASVAILNAAGETGLANEVASFNIRTQYVFFELLKEQDPEEAQRLGIP